MSPGVVAAATANARAAMEPAAAGAEDDPSPPPATNTTATATAATRAWLRADRRDALRALSDLERALHLRSLGFRARHGDEDAARRLRVAANTAAAALDGGAAAAAVVAAAEREGDFAAAAALAAAAGTNAAAAGALSALVAEAAAADAVGNAAARVDVVAAAAEGEHCVVQVIHVRDGTVAGISVADARLPRRRNYYSLGGGTVPSGNDSNDDASGAEWLGGPTEDDADADASADAANLRRDAAESSAELRRADAVDVETALGEATQAALEAYYYSLAGDGGGDGAADVPDSVITPHELPDPKSLERLIRSAARRTRDEERVEEFAEGVSGGAGRGPPRSPRPPRARRRRAPLLSHGADLPAGLPTALASLALSNARESARKNAAAAAAAESLAATLRLPPDRRGGRLSRIEGVDVSHLAGASTAASVVAFRDGRAEPSLHKRYELDEAKDGVAPGDDPAGIRAAVLRRCAAAKRAVAGKNTPGIALAVGSDDDRPDGALPDLILVDGGVAQLIAAARALRDAGVDVSNAGGVDRREDPDAGTATTPTPRSPPRVPGRLSVALAAIAKGRASGEEIVYVPRAVTDANATRSAKGAEGAEGAEVGLDFVAEAVFVGPGASRVRGGGADVGGGAATALLRAVRDESHAVALGAHRRRRRRSMFREMLAGQGGLGADDPDLERSVAAA